MSLIEIKDVTFSYGDIKALDGINLSLDEGMIVGLIGPNGSGKSTLMKCLCGLLSPRSGAIRMDGKDINNRIVSSGIYFYSMKINDGGEVNTRKMLFLR